MPINLYDVKEACFLLIIDILKAMVDGNTSSNLMFLLKVLEETKKELDKIIECKKSNKTYYFVERPDLTIDVLTELEKLTQVVIDEEELDEENEEDLSDSESFIFNLLDYLSIIKYILLKYIRLE